MNVEEGYVEEGYVEEGYKLSTGKIITWDELKKAAAPLVELLRTKRHSNIQAIVNCREVKITEDLMCTPIEWKD